MNQLRVVLNGTSSNPFHKMGLTQNPFSQVAKAEYDASVLQVQKLGGDPIPDTDYIRRTLAGYMNQEFIDLCCEQFKPGEMTRFLVTFPKEQR